MSRLFGGGWVVTCDDAGTEYGDGWILVAARWPGYGPAEK